MARRYVLGFRLARRGEDAMHLLSILYVTDVDRAIGFFGAFGYGIRPGTHRDEMWAELAAGPVATLALHKTARVPDDASGRSDRLQLSIRTDERLEDLIDRLRDEHGLEPSGSIVEEDFGRVVAYLGPDGLEVDVVEPPSREREPA
jgi:catechol 2,3-dioxygenase-like lactoylglutathione lyase family enzyme